MNDLLKSPSRTWRLARPEKILTNAESTSAIKNLFKTSEKNRITLEEPPKEILPPKQYVKKEEVFHNTSSEVSSYISVLFSQAKNLLDQNLLDWANLTFEQIRILILNLPPSLDLVQKMLSLAIEVSQRLTLNNEEDNQEQMVNKYREVLYLAERVGVKAIKEQIHLNVLVSDAYKKMLKGNPKKTDLNIRIVAYLSEAHWLSYKYGIEERISEIHRKIDNAEARFIASLISPAYLVSRLSTAFRNRTYEVGAAFMMIERLIALMLAHKEFEYVKEIYRAGLLEQCLYEGEKNGNQYIVSSLRMLNSLNEIVMNKGQYYEKKSHRSNGRRGSELIFNRMNANKKKEQNTPVDCPIPLPHLPKWSQYRKRLEELRRQIQNLDQSKFLDGDYVNIMMKSVNQGLNNVIGDILTFCTAILAEPPCIFSVIALGSLSRGDATPFSDIEYGIILYDETKREDVYWNNLCSCFEFFILCTGERAGFHIDAQGTPKTPVLRGTIDQLLEIVTNQKLDTNSVGMAFSLLRPTYLYGFPEKPAKSLFDQYILKVNSILSDRIFSVKYIASIFIKDHLSLLKRWTLLDERFNEVEIKFQLIQPLLFVVTDIAIYTGVLSEGSSGSIPSILNLLSHGQIAFFKPEFSQTILRIYNYLSALKLHVQAFYKEQFYGDKVSVAANRLASDETPFYTLNRDQVYWLEVAYNIVLKPLYEILGQLSDKFKPLKPIDPVLDSMEEYILNVKLMEGRDETHIKSLLKSTVSTLVFREADLATHIHYYKNLDPDLQLAYLACLTQHTVFFDKEVKSIVNSLRELT